MSDVPSPDPAAERRARQQERARRGAGPERRGAARARLRRRRALAGVALLAVAGAIVAAVLLLGGGDGPRTRPSGSAAPAHGVRVRPAHHARAGLPPYHGPTVSGAAARRLPVPILMYHVVQDPPSGAAYPDLWVSPPEFRAEVRAMVAAGYHGITLAQVFAAWRRGAALPRHPVVVSFDDGYLSHSSVAAPALRRAGWPGVLNLEIGNAGRGGISIARLRRLVRDGWEIDSHTMTHPDLTTLPAARLREELVGPRAWIRRHLGATPEFFCYPAGRYDATVIAAVRAAGYAGATTELPGPARPSEDPFQLRRIRVSRGEPAADVVASLRG
jgi:peptidoglycan/xylan/chitin deacetylase (PgdA/CDA1 family)